MGEELRLHFPVLPGFEGRPLLADPDGWKPFLEALGTTVAGREGEAWLFYGHGIGGSLLLEWAARNWSVAGPASITPQQVVLHSPIGASLQYRFFPKLMRPAPVRQLIRWMVYQPFLQRFWERRLFRHPSKIPEGLRRQFFEDYKRCQAFPVFFDLITPVWYQAVLPRTGDYPFHFLWGDRERVVASRYLRYWQHDFPQAEFELVPGWDHFPMLDEPESFYRKLMELIGRVEEKKRLI